MAGDRFRPQHPALRELHVDRHGEGFGVHAFFSSAIRAWRADRTFERSRFDQVGDPLFGEHRNHDDEIVVDGVEPFGGPSRQSGFSCSRRAASLCGLGAQLQPPPSLRGRPSPWPRAPCAPARPAGRCARTASRLSYQPDFPRPGGHRVAIALILAAISAGERWSVEKLCRTLPIRTPNRFAIQSAGVTLSL